MKRKVVLKLWKAISALENLKHDVRFSYFLAKNKVTLKPEIESLDSAQMPSKAFIEYENKRVETAQSFADKDASGNPKIHNGQYVISTRTEEFSKEIEKLKKKFKDVIQDREKQIEDYGKILDEEVEVTLSKIKFEQLPKEIESAFLEIFIEADIIEDDSK